MGDAPLVGGLFRDNGRGQTLQSNEKDGDAKLETKKENADQAVADGVTPQPGGFQMGGGAVAVVVAAG